MKKYIFLLAFGFVFITAPSFAKACHCEGDISVGGIRIRSCSVGYSGSYTDTCTRVGDTSVGNWVITSNTCTINKYDLEVKKDGTGSGEVTGGGNYDHGTIVTATATPNEGSTFTEWSSNCPGGVITLVENATCTATFTLIPDVCKNIDGNQESVPEGMEVSGDKECATPTPTRRSSGSIPSIIASTVIAEEVAPIPAVVGKVLGAETAVPEVIVPKLPKTGFPDQNTQPWYMEILSVFLKLIK